MRAAQPQLSSLHQIRAQLANARQLLQLGELERAEQVLRPLLQASQVPLDALVMASSIALQQKDYARARDLMEKVLQVEPDNPTHLYNYATALSVSGRKTEAVNAFRRALVINPDLIPIYPNLGHTLRDLGRSAEAIECYMKAFASGRIDIATMSQILLSMHLFSQSDHGQLFAMHRQLGGAIEQQHPRIDLAQRSPRADGKLRIGYLSPRFSREIVGYFFKPLFDHHDRSRFELYLYSITPRQDELTRYFTERADQWRDMGGADAATISRQIAEDEVDILIDLAGHAPENRIGVMAHRPAPLQVSLLDYFDTTGLTTIDYYVTDSYSSPRDTKQQFTETLMRLERPRLVYEPPEYAPEFASNTSTEAPLTFGSFNRHHKVVPQVVATWSRLLLAVPDSRLLLKGRAYESSDMQAEFRQRFAEHGVEPQRIEFRAASPHQQMLAEYADIDIALDTFPYNGGLTTCEALWMGTPVLTLCGDRIISRQTAGMLEAIGLPEFIAADGDDFARIGVYWNEHRQALLALRQGLRQRMAQSALTDAAGYTRELEDRLLAAWAERETS
ncbi:tetratricopeptide repeat protein [Haliea sp. E17]|uniref:O-linked N-acetylglucosamine transferase, SPINDLY family protein n=1 Tax=Haliea sp. E17 TaxID=3401576 RepID=UPI003AB101C2